VRGTRKPVLFNGSRDSVLKRKATTQEASVASPTKIRRMPGNSQVTRSLIMPSSVTIESAGVKKEIEFVKTEHISDSTLPSSKVCPSTYSHLTFKVLITHPSLQKSTASLLEVSHPPNLEAPKATSEIQAASNERGKEPTSGAKGNASPTVVDAPNSEVTTTIFKPPVAVSKSILFSQPVPIEEMEESGLQRDNDLLTVRFYEPRWGTTHQSWWC
jgi:hypothetical protein